jgi:hypothetical protein
MLKTVVLNPRLFVGQIASWFIQFPGWTSSRRAWRLSCVWLADDTVYRAYDVCLECFWVSEIFAIKCDLAVGLCELCGLNYPVHEDGDRVLLDFYENVVLENAVFPVHFEPSRVLPDDPKSELCQLRQRYDHKPSDVAIFPAVGLRD